MGEDIGEDQAWDGEDAEDVAPGCPTPISPQQAAAAMGAPLRLVSMKCQKNNRWRSIIKKN